MAAKGYSFYIDLIKLYCLCINISSTKQLLWNILVMFHFEPCFKVPWPVTSPSLIVDLGLIQQGCWFKLKTCLFKYRAYVNKDLTACLLNQRNIGYSWLHKRKVQRQTAISKQGSLGSRLLQYIHLVQGASCRERESIREWVFRLLILYVLILIYKLIYACL